jgi:hypothetical protein
MSNNIPLSRKDLKKISKTRLKEAKLLCDNQLYDGSIYLYGYVIETALKARICKILKSDYPPSSKSANAYKIHDLEELILLAGLKKDFQNKLNNNVSFKTNWSLIAPWVEVLRYEPIGKQDSQTKNNIINLYSALTDSRTGILTWIMKKW